MTIQEHFAAWNNHPRYIETYRGVILYKSVNRFFPFTGLGIVWDSQTLEALKQYIDKSLDGGTQYVNERGALVFAK